MSDVQGGIIEKIREAYSIADVIEGGHGYQRRGKAYLSPNSSTGNPGVHILQGDDGIERLYSHHGETDPLSSLNHGGHALDAADVICALNYNGDFGRMIAEMAEQLDPEGQKERQRAHAAKKAEQEAQANFEDLTQSTPAAANDSTLPAYPPELLDLPHQLGELQVFIANRQSYPSLATAGIAAIATLTAFAQTHLTIKSRDGLGFNEQYMILAPTGFGKEDLRKPLVRLNEEANNLLSLQGTHVADSVKILFAAPSSKQGLHDCLENNRSCFFAADEFAEWLRLSKSDGHKQAALGYTMEIYTKALGTVEPGHAVTNKYQPVKNPRLGILATSTAEAMFETMTREQADSGAYNRWVIFAGDEELPQKRYDGMTYDPPPELVEYIAWLKSQKPQQVVFSRAGFEEYKRLDQALAEPIKRKDGVLGARLGEQAIKLAGLVVLSDKRFTIEPQDLQTAFNIRIGLYHRGAALAADKGSLSGMHSHGEALQQVVGLFRKHRALRKSELAARSRKYKKLSAPEQQAVLRQLLDEGHARIDPDKNALLHSNYFEPLVKAGNG